jgi:hypothetical protein
MTLLVRAAGVIAGLAAALLAGLYALAISPEAPAFAKGFFPASSFEVRCREDGEPDCAGGAALVAAAHAPLGARALSQQLEELYAGGEAGGRAELASLVLSQDPRSELARVILADAALVAGDREAFLRLYLPLFETDRPQAAAYADALASVSGDPELFRLIEAHVRTAQPYWGPQYLASLAGAASVPLADMIPLYTEFPAAQPGLLGKLTAAGRWTSAYVLFTEFLSNGALAREPGLPALSVPYNPQLLEVKTPPPFNWQFVGQGAEWVDGGGVYAFFQGRRGETFLEQSFPLPPGAWRFTARMSGDVSETGGWFRWQLACAGGSPVIGRFEVHELSAAPAEYGFDFEQALPGCEFITLSLIGVPGTFPQPARIEVNSVALAPRGDE